jgi:hypothetical protein
MVGDLPIAGGVNDPYPGTVRHRRLRDRSGGCDHHRRRYWCFCDLVCRPAWFVGRLRRLGSLDAYQKLRQDLARSIILGLEFLIAGDIIRTVIVDQTLTGAAVLALIVLIRVMLSLMLEFEIEGRWSWQRRQEKS